MTKLNWHYYKYISTTLVGMLRTVFNVANQEVEHVHLHVACAMHVGLVIAVVVCELATTVCYHRHQGY